MMKDGCINQGKVGGDMAVKRGSWIQKSVKTVYENPWIQVTHEEVITPAGTDGTYGVVHFKNQAVGIVPIDDEGCTYLVRQTRYTLGELSWEIPEGGSPLGEDCLVTAKRELREETGLQAEHWQPLLRLHLSNSVCDEAGIVYVARGLSMGAQELEATEDIECKKLPLKDAIEMVYRGEITDAMSVAGLLRCATLFTQWL